MDYSTLISKLSNNKALLEGITKYIKDDSILNLTTADWETRLKNNATYQDFKADSKSLWQNPYENEVCSFQESKRSNFKVAVIGYCKFVKSYKGKDFKPGIIVVDCEPLNEIARAMTSDFNHLIKLSNEFKFNFMKCGRLTCHSCNAAANLFVKHGYNVNRVNQPCIRDTKVFDGKLVVSRFSSQIESSLSSTFIAVICLQINNRYSYLDANKEREHRIGGIVLNIIGFNESKLIFTDDLNIGPLMELKSPEEIPDKTDFLTEFMSNESIKNDETLDGPLTELKRPAKHDGSSNKKFKVSMEETIRKDEKDFLTKFMSNGSTENDETLDGPLTELKRPAKHDGSSNKKFKVSMEETIRKDENDFLSELTNSIDEIPSTSNENGEDSENTGSEDLLKLI